MRETLQPQLLHGRYGDPGLLVHVLGEGYAFLFDLGDIHHLSVRMLRRIRAVFITHTHVDHFIGAGQFLRCNLMRPDPFTFYGPPGFLENVKGLLSGFSWNLGKDYPTTLQVWEVAGDKLKGVTFRASHHFVEENYEERDFHHVLYNDPIVTIQGSLFNHGIPILAFRMDEHVHINVSTSALEEEGYPPGPWLRTLKQGVREGLPPETVIDTPKGKEPLGNLREKFLIFTPGQSIGYVTDVGFDKNKDKLVSFLKGVKTLVIDSAFPQDEVERAQERSHLTTQQAAWIGNAIGAHKLLPFHLSPRYRTKERQMLEELRHHFSGIVK